MGSWWNRRPASRSAGPSRRSEGQLDGGRTGADNTLVPFKPPAVSPLRRREPPLGRAIPAVSSKKVRRVPPSPAGPRTKTIESAHAQATFDLSCLRRSGLFAQCSEPWRRHDNFAIRTDCAFRERKKARSSAGASGARGRHRSTVRQLIVGAEKCYRHLQVVSSRTPCCQSTEELWLRNGLASLGYQYATVRAHFADIEQYDAPGMVVVYEPDRVSISLGDFHKTIDRA